MPKKKREWSQEEPQIDASYERRYNRLEKIAGHVTDDEVSSREPAKHQRAIQPYVPARRTQEQIRLSAEDVPTPTVQAQPIYLPALPQSTRSGHVRQTDDPITNARASLLYGHVIGFWSFVIFSAGLFYLWTQGTLFNGELVISEAFVLAVCMMVALVVNRNQGLHHSATGIAHHEIKSTKAMNHDNNDVEKFRIEKQAEVASHAIDKHAELLEKKWLIEQQLNKRLPGE